MGRLRKRVKTVKKAEDTTKQNRMSGLDDEAEKEKEKQDTTPELTTSEDANEATQGLAEGSEVADDDEQDTAEGEEKVESKKIETERAVIWQNLEAGVTIVQGIMSSAVFETLVISGLTKSAIKDLKSGRATEINAVTP